MALPMQGKDNMSENKIGPPYYKGVVEVSPVSLFLPKIKMGRK